MGAPTSTVAVVKRRHRSKLERRSIVEESLQPGASVAIIAQSHGVKANQVFHWRKLYREGRLGVAPPELVPVRIQESSHPPGSVVLECRRARIHLQGAVDHESLRIVLEHVIQ